MPRYTLDELELGSIIGKSIYTRNGHLLIKKGTVISYEIISKLKKYNISYYHVLENISKNIKKTPLIDDEKMASSISAIQSVFEHVLDKNHLNTHTTIPKEQMEMVKTVIEALMAVIFQSETLLYTVADFLEKDDYTYRHSVNVTVLTILTAKTLNYPEIEIKDIALGALLHDIGKIFVPSDLIKKTTYLSLSEQKIIKEHPELGYQLVKDMPDLTNRVKLIIRYHHEKLDGSGYPHGVFSESIPKYVRIVTICDMYDSMTTDRIYRKKMPIYIALEILMKDCVYTIDPIIYRAMASTICMFPVGQGVLLSDGRIGIVTLYHPRNPTRPTIKIIHFDSVHRNVQLELLDLQKNSTLFIVNTWQTNDFNKKIKKILSENTFNELPEAIKKTFISGLS